MGREGVKEKRGSKDGVVDGQVWVRRQLRSRCVIEVDFGTCRLLKISRLGGVMRARKRGAASPNPTSQLRGLGRNGERKGGCLGVMSRCRRGVHKWLHVAEKGQASK